MFGLLLMFLNHFFYLLVRHILVESDDFGNKNSGRASNENDRGSGTKQSVKNDTTRCKEGNESQGDSQANQYPF